MCAFGAREEGLDMSDERRDMRCKKRDIREERVPAINSSFEL
jgi:hypothetical protein